MTPPLPQLPRSLVAHPLARSTECCYLPHLWCHYRQRSLPPPLLFLLLARPGLLPGFRALHE